MTIEEEMNQAAETLISVHKGQSSSPQQSLVTPAASSDVGGE